MQPSNPMLSGPIKHPGGDVPGWDAAVAVKPKTKPAKRWSLSLGAHGKRGVRVSLKIKF